MDSQWHDISVEPPDDGWAVIFDAQLHEAALRHEEIEHRYLSSLPAEDEADSLRAMARLQGEIRRLPEG